MQYVNLKSIIRNVYKEEIENDSVSSETRLEDLYEKSRKYLLEIFDALDFYHELLKKDREYRIPKPDAEFIGWLLMEYKSQQMKLIRNGKYQEVEPGYLYAIIINLEKMLTDLEVDDIRFQAQMELIMRKTEYPLIVRLHNIRCEMLGSLNNLWHYTYNPVFHLSMDERCEYLGWVLERAEAFQKEVIDRFSVIWNKKEQEIKENALILSNADMRFSSRTHAIIEKLNNNQEFLKLREELKGLEETRQPLIKYKKKRTVIVGKMKEILNEVSKEYPIDIEQLTMLEKLMYTVEDGFVMTHKGGEDEWYVTTKSEYKPFGRRL